MLTPLDIEKKEFSSSFRGYSKKEVDEFLGVVLEEYETLYKECISLRDKVGAMTDAVQRYRSMEDTIQNALVVAQNTSEDMRRSATEKAAAIVAEAKAQAAAMVAEANVEVVAVQNKTEALKAELEAYKGKALALLSAQAEMIKNA